MVKEKAIFDRVGLKAGFQWGNHVFDIHGMLVGTLADCNRQTELESIEGCPASHDRHKERIWLAC